MGSRQYQELTPFPDPFSDRLDYLKDLGVNALYLNPVFDSPSLHKYGAARYWACFDFSDEE